MDGDFGLGGKVGRRGRGRKGREALIEVKGFGALVRTTGD